MSYISGTYNWGQGKRAGCSAVTSPVPESLGMQDEQQQASQWASNYHLILPSKHYS
jgi:hypothetical protein